MTTITQNLNSIKQHIQQLSANKFSPKLIAVSKTYSASAIEEAYGQKQFDFGENYVQELMDKATGLADLADIQWHFIGTIQSNKTKDIAKYADWVHTITKLQHARRLNDQRPQKLKPLNILMEVNISNEDSKHGLTSFEEIKALALEIEKLPNLKLRGLMGMASASDNEILIENQFKKLSKYLEQLNQSGFNLDQLSMGMSGDYPIAIKCGATMIRIGSKIFGARNYTHRL